MYRKIWIFANCFLIVGTFIYIWFFSPHDSFTVIIGQFLAQLSLLLFIININMYFIFLVIRKTPQRKVKIALANISRNMMKYHITIGMFGTIFIIGHAIIMATKLGPFLGFVHWKLISGYLTITFLSVTLFAGYLRHKKASGFRRKSHLVSAMIFALAFFIHMFS